MNISNLLPAKHDKRRHQVARPTEEEPIATLHDEMNRLFDDLFDHATNSLFTSFDNMPRIDVSEEDGVVTVSAELPGMDEKDISVEMDNHSVTIKAERKEQNKNKLTNWFHREQSYGKIQRFIALPTEVDAQQAKAKFKKGILTLTMPQKQAAPPRKQIAITCET